MHSYKLNQIVIIEKGLTNSETIRLKFRIHLQNQNTLKNQLVKIIVQKLNDKDKS